MLKGGLGYFKVIEIILNLLMTISQHAIKNITRFSEQLNNQQNLEFINTIKQYLQRLRMDTCKC